MKTSGLLGAWRGAARQATSSRRGFSLLSTFTRTMVLYQGLLTLAFVVLIALLFKHFLFAFKDVTLVVTAADEELVAMLDVFVNDGLVWLFALICTYTVCSTLLSAQGARYLQENAPPANTEQD